MEWLRHVDLSEYAPNLRGSGVHGALLVMEKRWTFELFFKLVDPNMEKKDDISALFQIGGSKYGKKGGHLSSFSNWWLKI